MRHALVDEALADAVVGGRVLRRLPRDLRFLQLPLAAGFFKTKHEIYLKEIDRGELSEWVAITPESEGFLVSLGAVSPSVNKFAFNLPRKNSQNRVNPQFPAHVGPPILVLESAGNGGGGGTSPQPQNDPVPCDSDLTATMASATAVLDGFALGADVVAVGAAGVAVATAPTVVGGISAAGVAAGARAASAVACVLSAGIKLYQGDTQGAIASGIGAVVGGGASLGSRIAIRIGAGTSRGVADALGEGFGLFASNGTEAAVCGVR